MVYKGIPSPIPQLFTKQITDDNVLMKLELKLLKMKCGVPCDAMLGPILFYNITHMVNSIR